MLQKKFQTNFLAFFFFQELLNKSFLNFQEIYQQNFTNQFSKNFSRFPNDFSFSLSPLSQKSLKFSYNIN